MLDQARNWFFFFNRREVALFRVGFVAAVNQSAGTLGELAHSAL
jgi:hypothetical protein